ncbi:MAG: hypothetical protein [crAssphage sp. isolate ctcc615]|uniref:Uncharacterized protein n=1 Tax=crAssphage sp. isolate ctcc615 TaxID=2989853 RepID=A0A345BNX2_9CAUD|nr:MAG: hypothetical protein KNU00_gp40 [crAssphage sp. isolate ctcc615]AXF52143.1 MAG: hypothetical protein [crAssphage sp. isolate ctcc615]
MININIRFITFFYLIYFCNIMIINIFSLVLFIIIMLQIVLLLFVIFFIFSSHSLLYIFRKIIFILFTSLFRYFPNIESTRHTLIHIILFSINSISICCCSISIFY